MARTSRRERLGLTRGKGMEQVSKPAYGIADAHSVGGTGATGQKTYSVGIYARLSVDSHNEKNESIDNQIEMAKSYMELQPDMVLFGCYSDV